MSRPQPRRSREPHDRLTAVAANLLDKWEETPGYQDGDRVVVMIYSDGPDGQRFDGGIGISGYGQDAIDGTQVMVDILSHLRAIFRSYGKDLSIFGIDEKGWG